MGGWNPAVLALGTPQLAPTHLTPPYLPQVYKEGNPSVLVLRLPPLTQSSPRSREEPKHLVATSPGLPDPGLAGLKGRQT